VTVEVSEFGAGLIDEEEQLGLLRVERSRVETVGLVWRDPPPDRRRLLTAEIVEQLRASPGRWAVVREYRSLTATRGWGRRVKHPADIELRGVEEPPGSVLYARARPRGDVR
jgi:hypothetical protein